MALNSTNTTHFNKVAVKDSTGNYINIGEELEAVKAAIANVEGADLTELTARVDALESPVSISSFSISGTTPSAPLEVGRELTQIIFAWAIANYNYVTSAKIRNTTASTDVHTVTAANGPATKTVSLTRNTPGTNGFQLQLVAGTRNINSSTVNVEWRFPYYYGNSASISLNEAGVKGLATKLLRSSPVGNYTIPDGTGYKYICIEKNLAQPSGFKDAGTGFAVAMQAPVEVTITNDYGVSIVMNVYRTTNSFSGAITIEAVA